MLISECIIFNFNISYTEKNRKRRKLRKREKGSRKNACIMSRIFNITGIMRIFTAELSFSDKAFMIPSSKLPWRRPGITWKRKQVHPMIEEIIMFDLLSGDVLSVVIYWC